MEGVPENNPEYNLIKNPHLFITLLLQSAFYRSYRAKLLSLFLSTVSFLSSSVTPPSPSFTGKLIAGMYLCAAFHLTCLLLSLEDNRLFTSAPMACRSPERRQL